MKDTFDYRAVLGAYTLDITFNYEGKVIVSSRDNEDNPDNVSLEYIEVQVFKDDDYLFTDTYTDLASIKLSKESMLQLEQAEQLAYEKYCSDDSNFIFEDEYWADAYEYSLGDR